MQPHQERVVQEKLELDEKLNKLDNFIGREIFEALPAEEKNRLVRQSEAMTIYSDILYARIKAFED